MHLAHLTQRDLVHRTMIHATAIIEEGAKLGANVSVGAYSVIGRDVVIGSGTIVGPHAVIRGHTTIGQNNRIFQFVSLGEIPQDKKYQNEPTRLQIGDDNTIREFCTLNIGTMQDGGVTTIGSGNWIMAYVHIAHDCHVQDHTILANCVQLAGHVHIGPYAMLGGFTGVHQFCRVGAHSMTGISTVVVQDVPPYMLVAGSEAKVRGINSVGLKRRNFDPASIAQLKLAYKTLYKSGLTLEEAKNKLATQASACAEIQILLDFLEQSTRGIAR